MADTPQELSAKLTAAIEQLPQGMPIARHLLESMKKEFDNPPTDRDEATKFAGNVAIEATQAVINLEARVLALETSAAIDPAILNLLSGLFGKK